MYSTIRPEKLVYTPKARAAAPAVSSMIGWKTLQEAEANLKMREHPEKYEIVSIVPSLMPTNAHPAFAFIILEKGKFF